MTHIVPPAVRIIAALMFSAALGVGPGALRAHARRRLAAGPRRRSKRSRPKRSRSTTTRSRFRSRRRRNSRRRSRRNGSSRRRVRGHCSRSPPQSGVTAVCPAVTSGATVLLGRLELQADRVDAVAQVGGGVVALTGEHMTQVALAVRAEHLDPLHAERVVLDLDDLVAGEGVRRTTASRSGIRTSARCGTAPCRMPGSGRRRPSWCRCTRR